MTKEDLAARLNGREYRREMTREEEAEAKAAGLVVVFGVSDDLLEFRGAICDEVDAYGGGSALATPDGQIIKSLEEFDHDEESILDWARQMFGPKATVTAEHSGARPEWHIAADIPHAKFRIVERNFDKLGQEVSEPEPYCDGIVFALADIKAPEDPARKALARLVAAIHAKDEAIDACGPMPSPQAATAMVSAVLAYAKVLAEAERVLGETERDWKAEARDDWSERALGETADGK